MLVFFSSKKLHDGYCIFTKFCFEEKIFLRQNQISKKGGEGIICKKKQYMYIYV